MALRYAPVDSPPLTKEELRIVEEARQALWDQTKNPAYAPIADSEKTAGIAPLSPAKKAAVEKSRQEVAEILEKPKREHSKKNPAKKKLTSIRLDADVLEAFRNSGSGWMTRINDVLRAHMEKQ